MVNYDDTQSLPCKVTVVIGCHTSSSEFVCLDEAYEYGRMVVALSPSAEISVGDEIFYCPLLP
jgi:hypothetical protein